MQFDRQALESLLTRRFFFTPSFEIYGAVAGLWDYGPPGTAMLNNFIQIWRDHFVLSEEMLELDLSVVTPHAVLKTSGHVDRFCDYMVTDVVTKFIHRADHLVKAVLQERLEKQDIKEYRDILTTLDSFSGKELGEIIVKHKILSPNNNPVTDPVEFNLMFDCAVGPARDCKAYLRPETAQGQFVNFPKLLEFSNKFPFASASIGRSFRNEISPRSGLLRLREFIMAEIEHFVDPLKKEHSKFNSVKHVVLNLLPANIQLQKSEEIVSMTIGEAVAKSLVNNETLGYFLARVKLFLEKVGINNDLLRFRQHMPTEMAHYACDCWDAELLCSYGWIECVGCADRSAFDLTRHSEATNRMLVCQERLNEPIEKLSCKVNKKNLKKNYPLVESALKTKSEFELLQFKLNLENGPVECGGVLVECSDVMFETSKVNVREFVPNVIEPSFGIGRILYCLLEQRFYSRKEGNAHDVKRRNVLALSPCMAPYKVLILPVSNHADLAPCVQNLRQQAVNAKLANRVDDSGATIGKRYARNDELGTPFAITVDFDTIEKQTVTLRERDSTQQVRISLCTVIHTVRDLVEGTLLWGDL